MSEEDYYSQPRDDLTGLIPDPTGKAVLDIGCGEGIFAAALKEKFGASEVWGVEPVEEAARGAAGRLDKVVCGMADACMAELPDGHFDMVLFNDSLEHMEDPWEVLRLIKPKLAPGGIICASIPNVRWYRNLFNLVIRGDWEYTDRGVLDRTHLRFFTPKSMQRMFHDTDYEVRQIRGVTYSGGRYWVLPKLLSLLTLFLFEDCFYKNYLVLAEPSSVK